jgi:hypothetical protein
VRSPFFILEHTAFFASDLGTTNFFSRRLSLGKPNFNFQKRQKELAKQKKNEEKKLRKLEKNTLKPADDQILPPADEDIQ